MFRLLVLVSALVSLAGLASAQTANCAAAVVFNQCLQNEDNYLKGCKDQDYACLCKWSKAKFSCWDNCPNDNQRGIQESLVQTYCSVAGVNATSSSAAPSATSASSSIAVSSSASSAPSSSAHPANSAATSLAPAVTGLLMLSSILSVYTFYL
ncbi:hypothetical protein VTP01DRAFT_2104 [Rhizomucor pusillus]|uniref:uncharacterized protein n=1 Tax=Rhizomucor pusillus TaxID=4840 RepID=UPI003741FC46